MVLVVGMKMEPIRLMYLNLGFCGWWHCLGAVEALLEEVCHCRKA